MSHLAKKFKNVLLIDDDPIINHINKRLMEIHAIAENITTFVSPEEALGFLRANPVFFDVIFLDIQMPAMDGFEFLEEYEKLPQALKNHSRLIVLSSTEHLDDVKKIKDNKNVFSFMNKPLNIQQLVSL